MNVDEAKAAAIKAIDEVWSAFTEGSTYEKVASLAELMTYISGFHEQLSLELDEENERELEEDEDEPDDLFDRINDDIEGDDR